MGENSIIQPDVMRYNNEGDSITTPDEYHGQLTRGLDAEQAALTAFAYAEIASGDSVAEVKRATRNSVRQHLMLLGSEPNVDELEQQVTATRQMRHTAGGIDQIIKDTISPQAVIQDASEAVKAGTLPLEDELLIRMAETHDQISTIQLDEPNRVTAFDYGAWVNRVNNERFAVDAAVSGVVAGLDPNYRSLLGDFLAEAFPFALSIFSAKLASDISESQGGSFLDNFMARVRGFIAPGEVRHDIQKLVLSVSPEERPAFARQLAISVKQNSGIIFDNDTETIDWIEHVISSADERKFDEFNWDRTLYNLITFLDAIPFLSRGIKGTSAGVRSWVSEAGRFNRKRARDFLAESVADPHSLRGLALDPDEFASGQLPKTSPARIDSTPSLGSIELSTVLDNVGTVSRASDNNAINYTAGEVAGVRERLASAYQTVKGGVLNINKFVIDVSQGDRILTDAFYTRTKNEAGWASPRSALNAALKLTDGDLTGVTLLVRNVDGGFDRMLTGKELRESFGKSSAKADGNEYFIQIRDTHYLSQTDLMAFGGNPVFFTGPFGSGRYLGDATAQFSEEVWKPSFVALGKEQQFVKDAIALADLFWRLPRGGRNRVTRLLEQGAKDRRTYSPDELVELSTRLEGGKSTLTVGDVRGYYAMRAANDAVWITANREVFKEMVGMGFRSFFKADGTESFITRPHTASDGTVKRAYNTKTGKIEDVNPTLLEQWEKKGGGIEVLHGNDPYIARGEETLYIIRDGGTTTQLGRLPVNLLRYEGGYVSRVYKDQFFVNRKGSVLRNGSKEDTFAAVHTAQTQAEADRVAAELTAATGQEHTVRSTIVDPRHSKIVNDTLLQEQDRLVFGRRMDDPVTRAGTDQAMLADPIESLHRAVAATGRAVGIEQYVKSQEVKFFKTYQDLITPAVWRDYQRARFGPDAVSDDLKKARDSVIGADRDRAMQALQLWEYYRMLRGVSEPLMMRSWRAGIRSLADKSERMMGLSPSTGRFLADLGDHDPFSILKGLVFTTLITANPIRQFHLQGAQFIYLAGANPRIAASAARHASVLRIGLGTIDTPNWASWKHGISRALRITEDEVEIMVREFKNSGLVAEMDSYAYMGATLTDPNLAYRPSAFGGGVQATANAIRYPFNAMKRVGFNAGETINLTLTYTFAMKKYLAESGKRVAELLPREWQEIGAQASGYALSMHKAGTYKYQQGLLSVLTQFWSIGHKAMAGMVPGKYGSKVFTNKEKAGIVAMQVGMYGAAGLGMHEAVQGIFAETHVLDDVPEDKAQAISRIVSNGIGEMLLNHMLADTTGEDVDMSFSTSFAPASGAVSTVQDFILALTNMDMLEVFGRGTAAGSTWGRYSEMASYISQTLAISETLPNTPSKLERIMTISPSVFSGYSNGLKAFYAMRTGQLVSTFGDNRSNITYSEAVIKGLLGVQTHEEADVARLYNLDGKAYVFSGNRAEEIASTIYKAQMRNLMAFEDRGDYNFNRMTASLEGERLILEILEPHEKEMVRAAWMDLAIDRRGKPDDILFRAVEFARQGAATPETVYSTVYTVLDDPKYDKQREKTLGILQDMIEGRNERVEWYLEQNKKLNEDEYSFMLEDTGF